MARLKSEIFVSAYMRRCMSEGVPAMLRRRGAADAGAIHIKIDHLDGTASLYAPASAGEEADPGVDRVFTKIASRISAGDIEARMAREIKFDSDLWWIEIEERGERCFLNDTDDASSMRGGAEL